jgi:FAD synthetase
MTLEELTSKYISSCEKVAAEIKLAQDIVVLDEDKIKSIVESAKQYLSDAKYYQSQNQLESSLASVAYCEGLLDALRLLGMVEFTWPNTKEKQ